MAIGSIQALIGCYILRTNLCSGIQPRGRSLQALPVTIMIWKHPPTRGGGAEKIMHGSDEAGTMMMPSHELHYTVGQKQLQDNRQAHQQAKMAMTNSAGAVRHGNLLRRKTEKDHATALTPPLPEWSRCQRTASSRCGWRAFVGYPFLGHPSWTDTPCGARRHLPFTMRTKVHSYRTPPSRVK